MKIRIISLLCLVSLCLSFVACGGNEPKRPIDYPDSTWTCSTASIAFSVSQDGKVTDATMVDKNGKTVDISLVFTDDGMVSITNADGTEAYITGTFSCDKKEFIVMIKEISNPDLDHGTKRLLFERQ